MYVMHVASRVMHVVVVHGMHVVMYVADVVVYVMHAVLRYDLILIYDSGGMSKFSPFVNRLIEFWRIIHHVSVT